MGVSGAGKTAVGSALARAIGVEFVEGDAYHSAENVRKMAAGVPLTDDDRAGWLRLLAEQLERSRRANTGMVLASSALKRSYRDVLRTGAPDVRFIHLKGPRELLAERLRGRHGHFMPPSLLDSQLETLEEPEPDEHAWVYDVSAPVQEIVENIVARVSAGRS